MSRITPLGHATVLLEIAGWTILTDPVLGDRIGMPFGPWTWGPPRLSPPPLRPEDLPPIDLVLLSHAHMDHADKDTLRRLPKTARALTSKGNGDLIRRFSSPKAMTWGESLTLENPAGSALRVTSIPSRHWGARIVFDRWRGWCGFLLEFLDLPSAAHPGQATSILFAGDTAYTPIYRALRERLDKRGIDAALMPIGAYDPWIFHHCSPEQAWTMAIHDLRATRLLPIHYDTFRLSREPRGEPLSRLHDAASKDKGQDCLAGLEIGKPAEL